LNVWPQDAVIQFNLGNLYLKSHPQLAVRRYALAVQYDPHFAVYRNSYAAALSRLGQPQQAYEQWKQAIADDPEYLDARHNLADLCANAGRIDEARAGYQAALRIDPHDGYALQKLNELPPR
jgi:tetratricopeptide (TPR) repeat protein